MSLYYQTNILTSLKLLKSVLPYDAAIIFDCPVISGLIVSYTSSPEVVETMMKHAKYVRDSRGATHDYTCELLRTQEEKNLCDNNVTCHCIACIRSLGFWKYEQGLMSSKDEYQFIASIQRGAYDEALIIGELGGTLNRSKACERVHATTYYSWGNPPTGPRCMMITEMWPAALSAKYHPRAHRPKLLASGERSNRVEKMMIDSANKVFCCDAQKFVPLHPCEMHTNDSAVTLRMGCLQPWRIKGAWWQPMSARQCLHLDAFCNTEKYGPIAIEYQGPQHTVWPNVWHHDTPEGKKAFDAGVERDRIKAFICKISGIYLISVSHKAVPNHTEKEKMRWLLTRHRTLLVQKEEKKNAGRPKRNEGRTTAKTLRPLDSVDSQHISNHQGKA
jgi:hypothetical protein